MFKEVTLVAATALNTVGFNLTQENYLCDLQLIILNMVVTLFPLSVFS